MKGLIILDFNRTLYDPDNKKLFEDTLDFLETYSKSYALALIAKVDKKRMHLLNSLNIKHYFKFIKLKKKKEESDFSECIIKLKFSKDNTWSIGDRIKKEIALSNKLGIKTIWFKNGKFAYETPTTKKEEPDFTITSLRELNDIIPS